MAFRRGGPEGRAVPLTREQRAARTLMIAAVGRVLRDSWSPEEVSPDYLVHLASQLEEEKRTAREPSISDQARDKLNERSRKT
jgi:hypothetical protein